MEFFSDLTKVLNGSIMPVMLILCGGVLAVGTKIHKILSPVRFFRTLADAPTRSGTSPFKAMCCALAGTLGVGNIAGVATAITSGGAGAVFWMWIGALFSMSVKYGEVALAVKYKRRGEDGYYGGSMYTFKDGLCRKIGKTPSAILGGIFAVMCIVNSVVTGNIVQSNAASSVFPEIPKYAVGAILAVGLLLTASFGKDKISSLMGYLIPTLSAVYIVLSVSVIIKNLGMIPSVVYEIVSEALSIRAVYGGILGVSIREAIRFGITRGILSNEAGCGTAPTAHASADVKSPHHQGCYGIFEVIADTLVLCSMTAFVILIGRRKYSIPVGEDGVPLSLDCFGRLLGPAAYYIIGMSVILFAFATIVAQLYYGSTALGYFTKSKIPYVIYVIVSSLASFSGGLVNVENMWIIADTVVGGMTAVNVTLLFVMRREIFELSVERCSQNNK